MIYYNIGDILIRDMTNADPQIITNEEIAQGWVHQKVEKYTQRLKDASEGKCIALVAEYKGYVSYGDEVNVFIKKISNETKKVKLVIVD